MNEQLPDDLQLSLEELEDENTVRPFISEYQNKIRSAIVEYRQRLMNFYFYFLTPRFLFFSLKYGFLHFLHLLALMSFLHPQLKHIFITKRAACAMRFFSGSVMGI
jgi:hypothetical protein